MLNYCINIIFETFKPMTIEHLTSAYNKSRYFVTSEHNWIIVLTCLNTWNTCIRLDKALINYDVFASGVGFVLQSWRLPRMRSRQRIVYNPGCVAAFRTKTVCTRAVNTKPPAYLRTGSIYLSSFFVSKYH